MTDPQPVIRKDMWLDARTPDPAWSPPSVPVAEPGPESPEWRPHPVAVGVAVLVLVLALIWALGGFTMRTDLRIPTQPAQLIVTGPYEFSFTKATAQRINRFGSEVIVDVRVIGTGRTTGNEAIAPSTLNPMFVARDEPSREVQESKGQRFGPGGGLENGDTFTPGLAPVEFTATFEFSENYRPGPTLVFAVAELEYTDRTLLGTGEKSWNNGGRFFFITLPLTQLPDDL